MVQLHVPNVRKHRATIPKHRQWPSPVGFRALKKRRSTRLNRPTPCTPRGAQGADLAAPLVGNGENGRRRRRGQFRGQYCRFVCLLIGLQDPTPLTQTHPDFPGMLCIWARWAGCPRRLPNKKLTKSYTRYPVGGASGPVCVQK